MKKLTLCFLVLFLIPVGILCVSAAGSSPDYRLVSVELPVTESTIFPGGTLHPTIYVTNDGAGSITDKEINVSGFLGNTSLIPVTSTIPSLPAGEDKIVTLAFQIPESFEFGGYALTVILDPEQETPDTNISNNNGKAGGMVSITPPDDEEFIGCEACWEGYR